MAAAQDSVSSAAAAADVQEEEGGRDDEEETTTTTTATRANDESQWKAPSAARRLNAGRRRSRREHRNNNGTGPATMTAGDNGSVGGGGGGGGSSSGGLPPAVVRRPAAMSAGATRPLILITDSNSPSEERRSHFERDVAERAAGEEVKELEEQEEEEEEEEQAQEQEREAREEEYERSVSGRQQSATSSGQQQTTTTTTTAQAEEQVEVVDGIRYRIVAAVTKPASSRRGSSIKRRQAAAGNQEAVIMEQAEGGEGAPQDENKWSPPPQSANDPAGDRMVSGRSAHGGSRSFRHANKQAAESGGGGGGGGMQAKLNAVRRKSTALVANLLQSTSLLGPADHSGGGASHHSSAGQDLRPRRLSIYEMTKSPPPETSLEIYLSERRRSSTISAKQVQQQLEQQSTFETNYCQRQQYFKDLNQKLINHDKKLLNVVANRGQIHRHSVDIAQLPLGLALAKGASSKGGASAAAASAAAAAAAVNQAEATPPALPEENQDGGASTNQDQLPGPIDQLSLAAAAAAAAGGQQPVAKTGGTTTSGDVGGANQLLLAAGPTLPAVALAGPPKMAAAAGLMPIRAPSEPRRRSFFGLPRGSIASRGDRRKRSRIIIRKFQKLDQLELSSTPAPDVKIGQRVAYKEYYGNEFGTIRWIGRVPQICPDWTVGVEFDNAIGEGDGSLNGRRYFIAKDCFAKFLPLDAVALVDQHVGRPEPGTMISVMSAAVRPGQMISIQRVSTVHVQHCFLNAPHQIPGADILAVNTRLHCQCPNCGPCAHVIKPPRTQRLARSRKNATHMCQFSTYTCCGMESQEETMCTYTGNKVVSLPPPVSSSSYGLPPVGNSWIEGSGYLTNLQAQQSKLMPEEYRLGAAPEDIVNPESRRRLASISSRRGSGRHHHHRHRKHHHTTTGYSHSPSPNPPPTTSQTTTHGDQVSMSPGPEESFQLHQSTPPLPSDQEYEVGEVVPDFGASSQNNNMQSVPSHTPSPIDLTVAYPDKTQSLEESNWYDDNGSKNKIEPKSAKVVYRDSIENRYLFPTDDPIDSTLEADLEDLSQARYGHVANPTRLHGSRNIFKSLRSLVSCLSAQSDNHSEFGQNSENTIRFSAHAAKGANNKSMPAITSATTTSTTRANPASGREKEAYYRQDNSFVMANNELKQRITAADQTMKKHISSSSDCGFSSASQNSINFQSHPPYSPVMSVDELRRTNQIYKRIVARLIKSTNVTNEDLIRLRRILYQPHVQDCCFHAAMNDQSPLQDSSFNFDETDEVIAEIFQKSFLHKDRIYEQVQRASSTCCHTTNYCLSSSSGLEMMNNVGNERSDILQDAYKKVKRIEAADDGEAARLRSVLLQNEATTHAAVKNLPRSTRCGSSTSESATLSSYDSYSGTAPVGDNNSFPSTADEKKKDKIRQTEEQQSSVVDNAINLPKAFELKLTLSINSDGKKNQTLTTGASCAESVVDCSSSAHDDSNPVSSTFNINIVSSGSRKEGGSPSSDLGLKKEVAHQEEKISPTFNDTASDSPQEQDQVQNEPDKVAL